MNECKMNVKQSEKRDLTTLAVTVIRSPNHLFPRVMFVYDLFQPLWNAAFPQYPPEQFQFATTTLPFTTNFEVITTLIVYYIAIHLGQRIIRWLDLRPLTLKWLFFVHNAFLSFGSLVLLGMILENVVPRIFSHGFYWTICHGTPYI